MTTNCYAGRGVKALTALFLLLIAIYYFVACAYVENAETDIDNHLILNCTFDYLKVGESRKYFVKQSPAAAGYKTVWESLNENVATVDEEGVVSALSGGETIIYVRAENTPYKAGMKLTVADETVKSEDGENALQLAVDKVKNDGYVLIIGGYYPHVKINKRVTFTGVEGAKTGGITICDGAELFMFSTTVYASAESGISPCVETGENSSFTAVNCSFLYNDPTGESVCEKAVSAPQNAERIYLRACSFSGYSKCVETGATDGEIYIVNCDFSDAETAVEIDLRIEGTTMDKNAYGKVSDNVYTGCKSCVKLYYNSPSYTGKLEISDSDVGVPS